MPAFSYRIADQIFQRFPGYVRGVVIAHDLSNGPSPPALVELLREAWQIFPDQRLTQLVINLADKKHDCGPVYFLEDTEMEKKLEAFVKGRRQTPEAKSQ